MRFRTPPTPLIILCLGFVVFSVYALSGFLAGLRLPELPLPFPNWYLLIRTGLWGIGGIFAAVCLIVGFNWSTLVAWLTVATVILWYWADRFLFARSDLARQSWPIQVIINLAIILWMFWTLNRSSVRNFFLERQNE